FVSASPPSLAGVGIAGFPIGSGRSGFSELFSGGHAGVQSLPGLLCVLPVSRRLLLVGWSVEICRSQGHRELLVCGPGFRVGGRSIRQFES
ncbi:hypothetical protein A2U01_0003869, partial [Trifolium medium]|nr:hypothetical protein [Trifolium medium]